MNSTTSVASSLVSSNVTSLVTTTVNGDSLLGETRRWELAAWVTAGACGVCTMILSVHLILKHLKYWTVPRHQSLIVKILFMVPIYTLCSFVSLVAFHYATYFGAVRDVYEAYVVYLFVKLVMQFGDGEANLTRELEARRTLVDQLWPLNYCCKKIPVNRRFVKECKRGVLQYVLIKPVLAALTCIFKGVDLYGESFSDFKTALPYVSIVANTSATVAVWYLVLFYMATKEVTAPFGPGSKLVAVKLVVFLSFWQGFGIALLNFLDWLPAFGYWTQNEFADGLQNYLTCVEMLAIAIGHLWWFSYLPYKVDELKKLLPTGRMADLVPYATRMRQTLSPVAGVAQIARDTRSAFQEKGTTSGHIVEVFRLDHNSGTYNHQKPVVFAEDRVDAANAELDDVLRGGDEADEHAPLL
jgi:hypothetical protein